MKFHLSMENMKMIIDMGASFDMSAMYLEKFYDGSYQNIEEQRKKTSAYKEDGRLAYREALVYEQASKYNRQQSRHARDF